MAKHKIQYDMWWEAVLEIKEDEKTLENLREQLLFFIGGQKLIDLEDGDVVKAYLKQMAPMLIRESMEWKLEGVKDTLADDMYEGILPVDGSFGVTLLSIDNWIFADNDFYIEKV